MPPFVENLIVSLITGAGAAATAVLQGSHDLPVIGSTGMVAFAGSVANGLRQLQKTP